MQRYENFIWLFRVESTDVCNQRMPGLPLVDRGPVEPKAVIDPRVLRHRQQVSKIF
jgi:hypothetical protein